MGARRVFKAPHVVCKMVWGDAHSRDGLNIAGWRRGASDGSLLGSFIAETAENTKRLTNPRAPVA